MFRLSLSVRLLAFRNILARASKLTNFLPFMLFRACLQHQKTNARIFNNLDTLRAETPGWGSLSTFALHLPTRLSPVESILTEASRTIPFRIITYEKHRGGVAGPRPLARLGKSNHLGCAAPPARSVHWEKTRVVQGLLDSPGWKRARSPRGGTGEADFTHGVVQCA